MDRKQIKRHMREHYRNLSDGYMAKRSGKVWDQFKVASADDKWEEYNTNIKKIDRLGFVHSKILNSKGE